MNASSPTGTNAAPSGAPAVLAAHDLTVEIGGKLVCDHLTVDLGPGQCWAVLGRNGAGKTTLLHSLAGLRLPRSGEVTLDGNPLNALARRQIAQRLGLLPQSHHDPFPARVLDTALAGRHPHLAAWQWEGPHDVALAREALARVDLAGLETRMVDSLSGGERRRLGLATVLTQAPAVFLLDEPVNHLDLHHQVTLLAMLSEAVREQGRTVVMAEHDLNLVSRHCDHVLMLFGEGETLHGPITEVMTQTQLGRLYGHPIERVETAFGPLYFPT